MVTLSVSSLLFFFISRDSLVLPQPRSMQPPPDFVSSRGSKRPADASGDNGAVEDKRARGGGSGGGGGASASSGDAAAAGGGVGGQGAGGSGGSGATHGLKSTTAAVTAALTANDGPRAIALLREMRALRQVPKLGAVQRWVRACDAAVHDPAALQVLDAVLRTCDPELVSVWLALVEMLHLHRVHAFIGRDESFAPSPRSNHELCSIFILHRSV
jgi:hypothetical protein